MNELIKIEEKDGRQLISGRELHKFLEIATPYTQWFDRMSEYGFVENKDFILHSQKCESSNASGFKVITDHLMTIATAKEISMIQRNEKGKTARRYFIKCEEAWNSEDMILARALEIQNRKVLSYKEQVEFLENKIQEDKPKVLFADSVSASSTSILIGELAKLIKQNGVDIGQNKLFKWLRDNNFLIKRNGTDHNMPTQKSMEMKLFEVKETAITHADGHVSVSKTPKVTGKGQVYFINLFLKKGVA